MRKCEQSCGGKTECKDTGECCHSCMYYVERRCITVGGNHYFPRHFRPMILGG